MIMFPLCPWCSREMTPSEVQEANKNPHVRLMAAAADLLMACEAIWNERDDLCDCNGAPKRLTDIDNMMANAIAAAKGTRP